jgi:putative ABC transport system permease protein
MDARCASRGAGGLREPAFGLAAIGTFALGIGAATAIFSVAYGVAFRPLPYPDADRLVRIYESNTRTSEPKLNVSEATFQAWRDGVTSLESAALYTAIGVRYTPDVPAQPVTTMSVTPRFFDVLGASPLHGRGFLDESNYGRGRADEVVFSYGAWQRLFGGDRSIVGRPVRVFDGDDPVMVAGVMPPDFSFGGEVDLWRAHAVPVPVPRVMRSWPTTMSSPGSGPGERSIR